MENFNQHVTYFFQKSCMILFFTFYLISPFLKDSVLNVTMHESVATTSVINNCNCYEIILHFADFCELIENELSN